MLGLGNSITTSGVSFGKPPISGSSSMQQHFAYLVESGKAADGSITSTAATDSLFDLRIIAASGVVQLPASNYTITSAVVTNQTTSQSDELITTPLVCDSVANLSGAIYFLFDDDTVLDDADFGSNSGKNAAHNGSGSNNYVASITFSHEDFSGEITVSTAAVASLTDSDA